jgi:16S rRNA (uracil1498-N3)-methyltransferase
LASYFLTQSAIALNQSVLISGDEAKHILLSRRIKIEELIEIQDINNNRYIAKVTKIERRNLTVKPIKKITPPAESILRIKLFQALTKEKSLDQVIQKATELGVAEIHLFQSAYSQKLVNDNELNKKRSRWSRIAQEAQKQSGRLLAPSIDYYNNIESICKIIKTSGLTVCLDSKVKSGSFSDLSINTTAINLLIGPEGGWKKNELELINCKRIYLGQRIMRSETAAISSISILQFLFGDLNRSENSN